MRDGAIILKIARIYRASIPWTHEVEKGKRDARWEGDGPMEISRQCGSLRGGRRQPRRRREPLRTLNEDDTMIQIKRVYDPPARADGKRFLVDRLWPRGVKKEALRLDGWLKEAAPSGALRQWFKHDPAKWGEFQRRYRSELAEKTGLLRPLLEATETGDLTLLYSAHDPERNNAIVLKACLEAVQARKK